MVLCAKVTKNSYTAKLFAYYFSFLSIFLLLTNTKMRKNVHSLVISPYSGAASQSQHVPQQQPWKDCLSGTWTPYGRH